MRITGLIVCDLDNCLSDDEWRRALIVRGSDEPDRFDAYHAECHRDALANSHIITTTQGPEAPDALVIITARPERYRQQTEGWFAVHQIEVKRLLMRPNDWPDSALAWKAQAILSLPTMQIIHAYDDHLDIVRMYADLGIPASCVSVHISQATRQDRWSSGRRRARGRW